MLHDLILQYGYIIVFAGCFLEGETVLVIGGIAAKLGYLDLASVMLTATAGSFLGDQLYFLIGRRYGNRLLDRWPRWRVRADRVHRLLHRHDTWFVLGFRFVYGLRTVSPFVLGTAGIPRLKFSALNFIAATVWAVAIAGAGYAFGHALSAFLDKIVRYERFVLEGALAAGLLLWILHVVRQRRRDRTAAAEAAAEADIAIRRLAPPD